MIKLKEQVSGPIDRIIQKHGGAVAATAKLQRNYDKLSGQSDKLGGKLKKLTVGAASFVALSYSTLQFETAMARANTMAGKGQHEYAMLTDQVRSLTDEIPSLRTELADGLYETISNGVPDNNLISFLQESSKASVGGVADLKEVIGVTATVIKNYNAEWTQAGEIQDKIQKTAVLGKTSFQELGQALPKVTGSAATLGVGIDELLGGFSALTGVSGNTAEVSTQLAAIFTALVKPSGEAANMANEMGISFDALSIKRAGGLRNFFDMLTSKVTAYSKATGVSSTEIYGRLFGSAEALRAFIPLTTSVAKDFEAKTAQVSNATGTINAAFATMTGTTQAKVQQMRNSFANMMDRIVLVLQPGANAFFEVVSQVLMMVSSFMQANPTLSKFVVLTGGSVFALSMLGLIMALAIVKTNMLITSLRLAALSNNLFTSTLARSVMFLGAFVKRLALSALGLLRMAGQFAITGLAAIGSFVTGLVAATAAQWGLNIAMNANPLGLIVIGVMAVIGVIALLYTYWDEIVNFLWEAGKFLLKWNPFTWMFSLLYEIFPGFRAWVDNIFDSVLGWLEQMWGKIKWIWDKIKAFFGFDGSAEVSVDSDVTADPSSSGVANQVDAGGLGSGITNPAGADPGILANSGVGSGGGSGVGPGGTGGGKILNFTVNISSNFTLPENWQRSLGDIETQINGVLNKAARDAALQMD